MSAKVHLVYFSPTGNVRKTLLKIAEGLGCEAIEHDLTPFEARWAKLSFGPEDTVIVGMPVYGGRIPSNSVELFRGLSAKATPCVFVVSYGGRDFEDALVELQDCCESRGFIGIGAAAFIGEHAFSPTIASGRPDSADRAKMEEFGRAIAAKLGKGGPRGRLVVKGNHPYTKESFIPIGPATSDACNACGECARGCPMQAINPADPKEVDGFRCINCFRCIRSCPKKAKLMDNEKFNSFIPLLMALAAERKEPETFI